MIPVPRQTTPSERLTSKRLLEEVQRERVPSSAAATDAARVEPYGVDATSALIEQAKGALMLHLGVDSHQAFAVLLGWARTSRTPLTTIAHTLLRGICEGNPHTEVRQRALIRWLEAQLREGHGDHARIRTAPPPSRAAHQTPRPG